LPAFIVSGVYCFDRLIYALEAPTYARYIAARSIIKQLQAKWNITKGQLPDIAKEDFTDNNEKLKTFSEVVDEWRKWASENSRFSFYFFDRDRENWLKEQVRESK